MSPAQSAIAGRVVIGMDPHKRSVTIEVMAGDETVLGGGRFATDRDGFRTMLSPVRAKPGRTGSGRSRAATGSAATSPQRLLADGEQVVDVPAEAVGAGAGVRHRSGPQDRRHRRALHRAGRHPDGRPAPGR